MKLEVGEYYLTEDARIISIVKEYSKDNYLDKDDYFYSEQGLNDILNTKRNIIAHIPKQLHKHILNEINSYYTDKDFKEVVDSVWGDK